MIVKLALIGQVTDSIDDLFPGESQHPCTNLCHSLADVSAG
jgi:hypothetical protein